MSTLQTIAKIRDTSVYDFFCPEEVRTCPPVLGKRVYDAAYAANIQKMGQLMDMTADQLRSKTFSEDLIPYICLKLQQANPGLNLSAGFAASSGAQGRVAAVSVLPSDTLSMSGYRYGA